MTKQFRMPRFKITWEPTGAEFPGKGDAGFAVGRYEVPFTAMTANPSLRTGLT